MNIWENAVITTKGLSLLAKLTGGSNLKITRAVTGAGSVTPGLLQNQTEISDIKQTLTFRTIKYPEAAKCALPCALDNDDLTAGYTAMQVGIYATDPTEGEILFFIAQAANGTGTQIPSKTEMPGYTAEWTFYFSYGLADGVDVYVDPANTVTWAQLNERLATIICDAAATRTGTEWAAVTSATTPTTEPYVLRFIAAAAYAKGDTFTINGDAYTVLTTAGKELSNGAWAKDAIVQLQVNPNTKTCFFNSGGADTSFVTATADTILESYTGISKDGEPLPGTFSLEAEMTAHESKIDEIKALLASKALPNLNFITAGAAQIREKYVGSDVNGNPVYGTRTCQVSQTTVALDKYTSGGNYYLRALLMMPDFQPDLITIYSDFAFKHSNGTNYKGSGLTTVDYVHRIARVGGERIAYASGSSGGGGTLYDDATAGTYQNKAFDDCEYASVGPGSEVEYKFTYGSVFATATNISGTATLIAVKF